MRQFVFDHPIIFSGSAGIEAVPGIPINASSPITASFKAIQDISTTGQPVFSSLEVADTVNVSTGSWIISKEGSDVEFLRSGSFDILGSLNVNNTLQVSGNMDVDGLLKAAEMRVRVTSSSVIFPSGSTMFGNSLDDLHRFTGSVGVGGENTASFNLSIPKVSGTSGSITYNITEFRNIPFPSAPFNQINPVTEFAGANLVAPFSANQRYIRKCFAKKGIFTNTTTAVFNAETASAPRSDDVSLFEQLPVTSKDDFLFFRNGMIMEQDALSVQQSGSNFTLTIIPSSIGYELESNDEIIAWGKFNS